MTTHRRTIVIGEGTHPVWEARNSEQHGWDVHAADSDDRDAWFEFEPPGSVLGEI